MTIIYDIMQRSTNLVQGNCLVLAYSDELTSLWAELDHFLPPDLSSIDRGYILQLRVFKFLMGLNLEY